MREKEEFTERDDLIEDLTWVRQRVRNCRGAVESGQITDKDVRGSLLLITERLDLILWRMQRTPSTLTVGKSADTPSPSTSHADGGPPE